MQLTRRQASLATLAALAICVATAPASAQETVDIAAAKKEGKIVWYTSTPVETANKISKLFETEYGIEVEMFRSGGSAILRRFQQEMQAGRVMTDVLTTSDPAASAQLARKGTFVPFIPKNFDKVAPEAKAADGSYIAQRLNMITMYVREDKVTGSDIPKTWADLADPKYKGKLVMTDPSFTALGLMTVATLSKRLGWDFYEKLRKNDIMIVQSNQQVSDMLKRGERLIAAGALDSYAAEDRTAGHPMLTLFPEDGVLIIPSPTAIVKGAPNPNAAKLFAEFMLSDAVQKLFPDDGGYAARFDLPPPKGNPEATKVKSIALDYEEIEKDSARVKRRFQEIFQ